MIDWIVTKMLQVTFLFAIVVGAVAAVPLGLVLLLALIAGAWLPERRRDVP